MMRALGGCGAGEGARADAPGAAPEGVDGRRRFEQSVAQARAGGRDRAQGGIDGLRSADPPDTAGAPAPTLETLAAAPLPLAVLAALGPAGAPADPVDPADAAAGADAAVGVDAAAGMGAAAEAGAAAGAGAAVGTAVDTGHADPQGAGGTPEATGIDRPLRSGSATGASDPDGPVDHRGIDRLATEGLPGGARPVGRPAMAVAVAVATATGDAGSAVPPGAPWPVADIAATEPSATAAARGRIEPAHAEPMRRDGARPVGPEVERLGEPAPDPFAARPQAGVATLEPTQSAARPDSRAEVLAQWILSRLPLDATLDRTVTLTFPGAGVPIEQIVLSREAGVLRLWVTARSEGREQVQAALGALGDRLRSRGLRVGALALA
jgi:hypothetical protein